MVVVQVLNRVCNSSQGLEAGSGSAAIQQANPAGVFIPLTHPNYSSFLERHFTAQSGFRLPSNSFIWFRSPNGQLLSREAAGLQTYVYSGQTPSDTAYPVTRSYRLSTHTPNMS